MLKKRQFIGIPFEGIIHQKAQRVDMGNTRGIVFDRPERYVVNTPVGQLEIHYGDWVIEPAKDVRYIIKAMHLADFERAAGKARKWWNLW